MKKNIIVALLVVLVVVNVGLGCVYLDGLVEDYAWQKMSEDIISLYNEYRTDKIVDVKTTGVKRTGLFSYVYYIYYLEDSDSKNTFDWFNNGYDLGAGRLCLLRDVISDN